jgi:C6 transcription factor Pro1
MEEIRRGVKRTTDGLRRARALTGLRRRGQNEVEDGVMERVGQSGISCPETLSVSQIPGSSNSALLGRPGTTRLFPCEVTVLHPELETILLMHYLDVIFPLQFPFYQPSTADGGRGWLLALLLQSRPLYDAALSLADWHWNATMRHDPVQRSLNRGETVEQGRENGFGYDKQLYVRAIAGLRSRIDILSQKGPDEGLKDSIEVLACIVQLIFLEVSFFESWGILYG